ncbi:LytR/AlgR family response regulator transcription factor [Tenacibaculum ovolyticum]|uniref:LytR/AlgR family response regulator transcription factor n=1 Tax=Tenacibaculum ovolyticum TaxID=104270 RepID=UPI001F15A48F|nr:response regulator transcription factor [Tenacibaculum ovolyticum]
MIVPVRVYVVEDVAISRISLETMLLENEFEVAGSAAKAETAWKEIQNLPVDLILLDINLAGEKNGVWLAQQVRKYLNIPIIYLTAFGDQQTLKEVLETKPNGYLMKPYQEPTLLTTIDIALHNFSENKNSKSISNIETEHTIFIKDRNKKVKVNVNDICYIKSEGNYIEITLREKKHVVRNKLTVFKNVIPKSLFFQCHQRYIINITKVTVLRKDSVIINLVDIPISLKYKKEMEELFPAL